MVWQPLSDVRDRAAFALLIFGGPLDLLYEWNVVTAHYVQQGIAVSYCYYAMLVFCALHIYFKLYYVTTTDNRPSTSKLLLTSSALQKCEICTEVKVKDVHHCKICNVCILRRDHHCWCLVAQSHHLLLSVFHTCPSSSGSTRRTA